MSVWLMHFLPCFSLESLSFLVFDEQIHVDKTNKSWYTIQTPVLTWCTLGNEQSFMVWRGQAHTAACSTGMKVEQHLWKCTTAKGTMCLFSIIFSFINIIFFFFLMWPPCCYGNLISQQGLSAEKQTLLGADPPGSPAGILRSWPTRAVCLLGGLMAFTI